MRILHLDTETAPNEAYVWNSTPKWIPSNQMRETSRVMCFAYKWEGSRQIGFVSEWNDGRKAMIESAHNLLSYADAVITYNGNRFDIPVLNREFLLAGLSPPEPYHSVDLFRTVKREFKFTHNSLSSVCAELGIGEKTKHPGFQMWLDVMNGVDKAQKLMEKYNKQDVRLMPTLYHFLLPWIRNHPNHALYTDTARPLCPNCGSHHMTKQGFKKTKTQIYQQYKCGDCGTWMRDRYTQVPAERRPTILTGAL